MRKSYGPKAASVEAAQKMLVSDHIAKGLTVKELAIKYDREMWEVQRLLTDAQRTGVYEKISDMILKNLVPEALASLKVALLNGDSDVALRLLEGKGILQKGAKVDVTLNDPLAEYRKEKDSNESPKQEVDI